MADASRPIETSDTARAEPADSTGVRLFAASARNLFPRLISSICVTGVGLVTLGPVWASLWFLASWAAVFAGMGLMKSIQADPTGPRASSFNIALTAVNVASGSVACLMPVTLWLSGDELTRTFGLVTLFIGAAYVLLQYYANLKTFLVLITPYAVSLAFIGWSLVLGHAPTLSVALIVIAALATLVNFFNLSRLTLDNSRRALRRARAKARDGEQAAGAANEAKSAFLATMSHEIRTPLNGVLGMTQAMAADALSPVQKERLEVIRQSGEALLAILNDVLDLSKIEAGRFELESVEFDLAELMRGAHSAFTAIANKKGLSFDLTVEAAARGVYLGDPTRLRQILYNLISNALKFTEHGEVRVTAARLGEALTITVSDTGVGIAEERQAALFEKFTQADASTTRRFGGTGLGLAICRELVQLMGGEIRAESSAGEGSRFTVTLPIAKVGEAGSAPAFASPPPSPSAEPGQLKIRVLAAEDNSVNQLVLKTLLHQIGVDPMVVDNGAEAIEAWEKAAWDVILMDMQMPVVDGLTATRRIREAEAASGRARTPIIALTANAMSHQMQACLAAGMDGHVAKPIEAARLFEALEMALAAREPPSDSAVG